VPLRIPLPLKSQALLPTKPGGTRFRWVILTLLFTATVINYMDRQILGLLKPDLARELSWTEADYSRIVIAFQAAYAVGQALIGPVAEWFGMRLSYAVCIVIWSLAAMGHAGVRSVFGFGVMRFVLGAGESGNFPLAIRTVAEWFPARERAFATGLFNSGTNIGAVVAPLLVPVLALAVGWRLSFVVLGVLGFVWLLFWWRLYASPGSSPRVDAAERAHILDGDSQEAAEEKLPWRRILGYRQSWAYFLTCVLVGPVWWFYLFWLPDIFSKQFGLDMRGFGLPLVVVYTVTAFGGIAAGYLSSRLLRRGWSANRARKSVLLLCAVSTLPVVLVPRLHSVWLATACFALAAAGHQGWSANMYTVISDIFPRRAVASVVGFGGMLAALVSMLFSYIVGQVLQSAGVYDNLLLCCGSAYVLALVGFHLLVPRIRPLTLKD